MHTLITHGAGRIHAGTSSLPESIHASFFGSPGDSPLAGTFRHPVQEWRKGGRLIEYLRSHNVRAVILFGYRYLSFLRVIRYCRRTGIPAFVHNDSNIHGDRHMPAWKRALKSAMYRGWLTQVSGVMSMGEYGDQFFLRYGADRDAACTACRGPSTRNTMPRSTKSGCNDFARNSGYPHAADIFSTAVVSWRLSA